GTPATPAAQADPAAPGQLLAMLDGYRLDALVPAAGQAAPNAPLTLQEPAAMGTALATAATSATHAASAVHAPGAPGPTPATALAAALDTAGATAATAFPLAPASAATDPAA